MGLRFVYSVYILMWESWKTILSLYQIWSMIDIDMCCLALVLERMGAKN